MMTEGTQVESGIAAEGQSADMGQVDVVTGKPIPQAPAAPESEEGQSTEGAAQTTEDGPEAGTEDDTFFDPKEIPDELKPAYKNMQAAFTRKMQELSGYRQKVDAYNAFEADPVGTMQELAKSYGFRLTRAEAEALSEQQTQQKDWQPNTWEEVEKRITQQAEKAIMQKFQPLLQEFQNVKKQSVERTLDEAAPDWRKYEPEMIKNLKAHPTLANDPVKLYMLSVPPEVVESRAYQEAIKKMKGKVESTKIAAPSTGKATPKAEPDGPLSFDDAVAFAKTQIARGTV